MGFIYCQTVYTAASKYVDIINVDLSIEYVSIHINMG